MNNKIRKLQWGDYFLWNNLSREDKVKRNKQIAKLYLDKGPSILNYYNALKAYFGGFNPKNPYLLTGEPIILPGMNSTKGILTAAKAARTLEDYLKTTKVTAQALEGSSATRSAYATDRYLGGVMFENNLPEAASQIQGHGMAKASTLLENLARLRYILDNGLEKGKTFFTAPLKVSDARIGSALGTGGGKPYFDGHFLITGKPGQMINSVDDIGTIYINDAYENEEALKAAQKIKEYLTKTYPNKVFKLYSEGFKKGGTIKTANARKWKHKEGGIIKAEDGTKTNWQSALTNIGTNLFNSYLQSRVQNNKINSEAEVAKAENEVDLNQYFWDTYLQELAKALLEELLKNKAISAMNDTVINSSPLVTLKIAYDKASKNYGNLKANLDARNKVIDEQAKAAKSSVITDAVSGVIQNGLGMLKDYYGSKNNNSTSSSTNSNSYFDNTKYKKFGTFNPDGSMNMLGGTFTINGGYKPNQPQLFNYQPLKLNI